MLSRDHEAVLKYRHSLELRATSDLSGTRTTASRQFGMPSATRRGIIVCQHGRERSVFIVQWCQGGNVVTTGSVQPVPFATCCTRAHLPSVASRRAAQHHVRITALQGDRRSKEQRQDQQRVQAAQRTQTE
eukprot:6676871-Prymnesium_polylepis.1